MTRSLAGIYKITNTVTGKIYVGQSQNVYERKIEHFTALRRGYHSNKLMQEEWNKNNRSFRFDVIEFCPLTKLNEREQYWIETLKTLEPNGYNQGWVPYKRKKKSEGMKIRKYRRTR